MGSFLTTTSCFPHTGTVKRQSRFLHTLTSSVNSVRLYHLLSGPLSNPCLESLCPATLQMLESLASQEDVADVLNLYNDCFNSSAGDSSQLESQVNKHSGGVTPWDDSVAFQDVGEGYDRLNVKHNGDDPIREAQDTVAIEVESTMSPSTLSQNLGFVNDIPILFNTHKHSGGVTPWDDSVAFQDVGEGYDRLNVKHNGDDSIREAQDTVARLRRKAEICARRCLLLLSRDDALRHVPDPKPDEHVSQKT